MVKFYQKTHEYPESTATPLLAFFLRYPNPFARHVLSVDVLSRSLDPITGQLHTTRLILKRGIIPKWSHRFLPTTSSSGGRGLDAWVLEESVVDPPGWGESVDAPEEEREYRSQPKLQSQQGNLNHRKFMHIIEGGDLRAGPKGNTIHRTTAEVRSNLGGAWSNFMRQRIETYGVGKFEGNTETARKGMTLVMDLLRRRQPLPDTAEFYPPPPPQFGDRWPTTEEANASSSTIPKSSSSPTSFFLSRLVGIQDTETGQTSNSPSNHSTTNNDNNDI